MIADNDGGNCNGSVTDGGGNLRWPATDTSCVGAFGNPLLGPLQDNGGPTWTMLPGTGSAAIDAVACDPAVRDDQRGAPRPHGPACDIGAVEVGPVPIIVTTLADSYADDGLCSLREAIGNANGDDQSGSVDCASGAGEDLILFQIPGTIILDSELPELTDTERSTISGDVDRNGSIDIVVSGNDAVRVFAIDYTATVTLHRLTITNGNSADSGGGVLSYGDLLLSHCIVSDNSAYYVGGGILSARGGLYYSDGGILTVEHSTIAGNTAGTDGGGIFQNGTASITNSTLYGNHAEGTGGAIEASIGSLTISQSTVAGNSATDSGGIFVYSSTAVTLVNTVVSGNQGANCGDSGGTLTDGGGNLRWPATDNSCVGSFGDPMFGPLQDNGGPTWTMLPGNGSAAVDAVACDSAVTDDQRGVARPQGPSCDIGAVEVSAVDLDRIFANGFDHR